MEDTISIMHEGDVYGERSVPSEKAELIKGLLSYILTELTIPQIESVRLSVKGMVGERLFPEHLNKPII